MINRHKQLHTKLAQFEILALVLNRDFQYYYSLQYRPEVTLIQAARYFRSKINLYLICQRLDLVPPFKEKIAAIDQALLLESIASGISTPGTMKSAVSPRPWQHIATGLLPVVSDNNSRAYRKAVSPVRVLATISAIVLIGVLTIGTIT